MPDPAILIVDDVADIVDEMVQMLALLDLIAVGAGSIGAGMALLQRHDTIRVVVCDLRLPGENGREILDRIASTPGLAERKIAYIFMTGDADQAHNIAERADTIVLTKPINPRLLISSVADLLEGKAGAR